MKIRLTLETDMKKLFETDANLNSGYEELEPCMMRKIAFIKKGVWHLGKNKRDNIFYWLVLY